MLGQLEYQHIFGVESMVRIMLSQGFLKRNVLKACEDRDSIKDSDTERLWDGKVMKSFWRDLAIVCRSSSIASTKLFNLCRAVIVFATV